MPSSDRHEHDISRILHDLIVAFSRPHLVHPAYVEHVLAYAADLLRARRELVRDSEHQHLPLVPRSTASAIQNPPPAAPTAP